MQQSHGMGYAEYSRGVDQLLKVEKRRQKEYEASRRMVSEAGRQIHK
ncbi:hypothetical protein [Thalassobacillus hwangdonensis]|uniref:Uncharacterized protein n=1 Tax=Thalassobacillus hwangdonensis TaxID=546108 RepID=A0ABW3L3A0_9BACI